MRRLLVTIGALSLLGCGGDSSGPGVASAVGTWNLQTVNGQGMPYTVFSAPGYRLELVSDVYVIRSNGTFTETVTARETDGASVTTASESYNGTWAQDNAAITVTYSDGSVDTGAISGDVITSNVDGDVYIYRRQ